MSVLRLLPWPSAKIVNGEILFENRDLVKFPLKDLQSVRGSEIACIFQEPMQALNPVVTIKKQLLEVFKFSAISKNAQSKQDSAPSRGSSSSSERSGGDPVNSPLDLIREQLRLAGFTDPDRVLNSYPHELSGGMLQRVCIVMALLPKPKLIIADEPTTALDVTVQAQVLAVLKEMAEKTGTAVLLITHNMGIVSQYAHRVAVMYAGRIVEEGPVREVINHPMHPYTQGLLAAIPESHSDLRTLASIPGSVPHPKDFAKGCRFADRCSKCAQASADVREKCLSAELPPKIAEANHFAYCFCAK
jgi:oligopeptide/dipeptide ABC transporter ATP-binding protein